MQRCLNKIFVILFLFALLLSCAPEETSKIKVGVILPLTGPHAFYGEEQRKGVELVQPDNLEIIYEDHGGEMAKGVSAFQKLANVDNVNAVVTSQSWVTNAIYPQASTQGKIQLIIASAAFKRTQEDKAVSFTVDVADEASFLIEKLSNYKKIGVIYLDNDFGKGWAKELEKSEKVVASEPFIASEDPRVQLTKIKEKSPDAVVVIGGGKEAAIVAKRAQELGIPAQLVGSRPIEAPDLLAEPAAEGFIYTYPEPDQKSKFAEMYQEKYGTKPSNYAAESYDAVAQLDKAVQDCKRDSNCIHKWFINREYDGALGHVKFDEKGNAHYPFILKQVREGKFVEYKEIE